MKNKAISFEKSNVEDLKEKLSELLSDKSKVEKYRKAAQNYVCTKYNWDNVVDSTLQIYR